MPLACPPRAIYAGGDAPRGKPPMYMPENDDQLFDILSELRVYASLNGMPLLAERLDDALMVLAEERGRAGAARPPASRDGA